MIGRRRKPIDQAWTAEPTYHYLGAHNVYYVKCPPWVYYFMVCWCNRRNQHVVNFETPPFYCVRSVVHLFHFILIVGCNLLNPFPYGFIQFRNYLIMRLMLTMGCVLASCYLSKETRYDNDYDHWRLPIDRLALAQLPNLNGQHGGVLYARRNMI